MHWLTALAELRTARQPGVLVTVTEVRGHAPREAGAKMVVGQLRTWGTIGGGNLEQEAVVRARELIADAATEPSTSVTRLSDRAPARHGVQCCGGEVTLLFEPQRPVPAIAIFGIGHVGTELALVLARHDIELHLVDSRAGQLDRVVRRRAVRVPRRGLPARATGIGIAEGAEEHRSGSGGGDGDDGGRDAHGSTPGSCARGSRSRRDARRYAHPVIDPGAAPRHLVVWDAEVAGDLARGVLDAVTEPDDG